MNTPQCQFNFGNPDPILTGQNYNMPDCFKGLDDEIARLNSLRQQIAKIQQPIKKSVSLWDEIDKEVSALTNEQKSILAKDENYRSIDKELQIMVQQELINSVKEVIENSQKGKELLERQLKYIKDKKTSIVEESNREIEIFKRFQIAVQANPNLTYAEFIKTIK